MVEIDEKRKRPVLQEREGGMKEEGAAKGKYADESIDELNNPGNRVF